MLHSYGSPAKADAQAFVDAGEATGIDDAYVLAMFIHESGAGTNPTWAGLKGNGNSTHNVGNIICTAATACYEHFADYPDWPTGIRASFDLLAYYRDTLKQKTIGEAIDTWAPPIENNTNAYKVFVEQEETIYSLKSTTYNGLS